MSSGVTSEQQKRQLYWLGERLIDHRLPVSVVVILVTSWFAWHAFQLKLETSFSDLLPQSHPFVQIHNKYAPTFGGANNIQLMVEAKGESTVFSVATLTRVFKITEAVDQVYGVNHNQIDSIGHRTTRYLRATAGGTLRAEPVMTGSPKSAEDAASIQRIVHNTESIYGILVSLDDRAALVRANFIEQRLDHRRTFTEINERVIAPFKDGWIGAVIKGRDTSSTDSSKFFPAQIETVLRDSAAAAAGLKTGDIIERVNGEAVADRVQLAKAIAAHKSGETVALSVKRGDATQEIQLTVPERDIDIYVAGEPRLYGHVYQYATDVFAIFTITYCLEWLLRWFYFHDWRGSLRPTLTGVIAALWGFGFIDIIGFALDPLMLVMPFLITARAVSHAIQMHDRYYEEFERHNWDQRKAIVAAFAELFVPTLSGILTDAFGVLVIMMVPIVMLRKLAIVSSFWILAITVAEIFLNPIVYYYLRAPDKEVVLARDRGWYKSLINRITDWNLSPSGKVMTLAFWGLLLVAGGLRLSQGVIVGDPTSASPLVWEDSPYNLSHSHIQEKFGGVEPLIVVAEGKDRDAMKDPGVLRTMEKFQRYLERDSRVGYSFSLTDILRSVNMVFHEFEPKWGVIPNNAKDIAQTFFIFFSGAPPTETAKYVTPDYQTAHVTFFCRDHKGENIARIIEYAKRFIAENPMYDERDKEEDPAKRLKKAEFKLAGGLIGVLAAANQELLTNDGMMNLLGFGTIYCIVLFTYRSFVAGIYLLLPLLISNVVINAGMATFGIGINVNTLPLVTVGVGFGIDYGLYIVSRIIEEIRINGDLELSIREALVTSGKAVSFTAVCMVMSTAVWVWSNIRFDAVMGGLLAVWMFISFVASENLMPVMISYFRPKFILREAGKWAPKQQPAASSAAAAAS